MKSRWKTTGNDIISQISIEFLKQEILELVEVCKTEIKTNKLNKSDINIAETELVRLSNLLIRISNKTENERKKFINNYPDKIESMLIRIYRSLNLIY